MEEVLDSFNDLTPSINFAQEREKENKLSFLNISIIKTTENISFDIYRKSTTSGVIIPSDSCHPQEQKVSAIRYFSNRINTCDLDTTSKRIGLDTVRQIIHNNKFDISILDRVNYAKSKQRQDNRPKRWAKFSYIGKETRQITNLFRNIKLKVAYITKNNLGKLLNAKSQNTQQPDKYE